MTFLRLAYSNYFYDNFVRKQEELRANSEKMKKLIIKNDKMSARQNLIKLKDK